MPSVVARLRLSGERPRGVDRDALDRGGHAPLLSHGRTQTGAFRRSARQARDRASRRIRLAGTHGRWVVHLSLAAPTHYVKSGSGRITVFRGRLGTTLVRGGSANAA